jgi:hypothetical protein
MRRRILACDATLGSCKVCNAISSWPVRLGPETNAPDGFVEQAGKF